MHEVDWHSAIDDAQTILAAFGSLGVMVNELASLARHGSDLADIKDHANLSRIGSETEAQCAQLLIKIRGYIECALNDAGDYFNAHDGCTKAMEDLSSPVYAMLRNRKDGKRLQDC